MSPKQNKHILVIEDTITYQQALKRAFLEKNYTVVCASSGEEGLELLKPNRPDLIVLDLTLPGMSGQDVCRSLKINLNYREIPIMVLTMHTDDQMVMEGLEAGADSYVNKNEPIDVILKRAEALLSSQHAVSEAIITEENEETFSLNEREILLVDDDITYLQGIKRALAEEGYKIRTAMSGTECLEKIKEKMPDLLLLDLNMPEMQGDQVCREIRKNNSIDDLPIVMLTASESHEDVVKCFDAGINDFVVKSGDFRVINLRIYSILRRQHFEKETERIRLKLTDAEKRAILALSEKEAEKKFAAKLTAEKERLAVTLKSIGEGVIVVDQDGVVSTINDVGTEILGFSREEILSKPLKELLLTVVEKSSDKNEKIEGMVSLEDGLIHFEGLSLITKEGKNRLLDGVKTPLSDSQGNNFGAVLVFKDVYHKQKAQEESHKTSKLEAIGTLAAGIAHDFNNLLTGIMGNVSFAKMKLEGDVVVKDLMKLLDEAELATQKAAKLTGQLLTYSKGGDPIKKKENISKILSEAASIVTANSDIEYTLKDDLDLWPVEIDASQIVQALQNVFVNAKEAMPNGGTICLEANNVKVLEEDPAAKTQNLKLGNYVKITIHDEGVGISDKDFSSIFDPFFSTKEQGSGLGLMTAHSIIKKHKGAILVESKEGVGTTVFVYLPALEEEVKEVVPTKESSPASNGSSKKSVLLMDDEEYVLNVASSMLKHLGYEAIRSKTGEEAIAQYKAALSSGSRFDLVIMDLSIPDGMGGKEAIEKLRELDPDVQAIVCSGYSNDPVMSNYQEYGFKAMMSKPYNLETLKDVVKNFL